MPGLTRWFMQAHNITAILVAIPHMFSWMTKRRTRRCRMTGVRGRLGLTMADVYLVLSIIGTASALRVEMMNSADYIAVLKAGAVMEGIELPEEQACQT